MITSCETPTALDHLRHHIRGSVHGPGEPTYDAARRSWNLNADHRPALVVRARTVTDVQRAVRHAAAAGLGVGVMATGHGTGTAVSDGVLVNTADLGGFRIDPAARTARVAAGERWAGLVAAAAPYGLAGLTGSSPAVGIVGYTLGGGFGWLGRRYGLAAHSVTRAELVTATGELITTDPDQHPELFWGLQGGTGNFGIVTALEFRLHPVAEVYAGNLYYPLDRARDLLTFFAEWSRRQPIEFTAAVTFRRFPPLPTVPEPLRGRSLVALRGCWCGPVTAGEALVDQARVALGPAAVDTFAVMPAAELARVSMDPVDPLPARSHAELIADLSPGTIDDLVALAGPDSGSPLVMTEIRQLGGALDGPAGSLSPMAHSRARYSLNAIGVTPDAAQTAAVAAHLDRLRTTMRPHATGEEYLNFLDLDGATPDRVRAAYSTADWTRLTRLKARYDPDDVFRFNRNIPLPTPVPTESESSS